MTKEVEQKPLRSYLFDCGNSAKGVIGFCARVQATSPQEALQILQDALPECAEVEPTIDADCEPVLGHLAIEYMRVYIKPRAISVRHITDVEDVKDDADDEDAFNEEEEEDDDDDYA